MQVIGAIVILGIIATIATVAIFNNVNKVELAKGKLQADLIQDTVADYMVSNNGDLPLLNENDDYIEKPAFIDLSKIEHLLNNEVIGNFYIYGPAKTVYFDYPTSYISQVYNEYDNKDEIIDINGYIDTDKLFDEGILENRAITRYILISGDVVQVFDENRKQINTTDGDNKPTKPIIIPSKSAPYYNTEEITFTARSYSSKGEVRYEWEGISNTNKYTIGTHDISVVAYDIDGNASDKSTFELVVQSINDKKSPPNTPVITKSPDKAEYSSSDVIELSAVATHPDGALISEYVWIGKSSNDKYRRGEHTVSVYAVDEFGGISPRTSVDLKVVNGPPEILDVEQVPDPAYRFDTIDLKIEAQDPDGDLISYEIQGANSNRRYSYTHENRGVHNVTIIASDTLGAKSEPYEFPITVTNRPPTMPDFKMNPGPDYKWIRPNTRIRYTASGSVDLDRDFFHYEYRVNNESWTKTKPDGTYNFGSYVVSTRAVDEFGAVSEVNSIPFDIVNTPPTKPNFTMSPVNTSDFYIRPNTRIRFNASGSTDREEDYFHYEYKVGNGNWSKTVPNGTFDFGSHTVYARAVDEWGAISSVSSVTFDIVNTPPTKPNITMSPVNTSDFYIRPHTRVRFSASGSTDREEDYFHYEYKVGNGEWSKTAPSRTFDFGSHTVYARAVDEWGAISSVSSVSFNITNTAPTRPTITISPSPIYYTNTHLTFTASGSTDREKDRFDYEYRMGNGSWSRTRPRGTFTIGNYTIQVRAVDEWGAISSVVSQTFEIKNTAPTKPEFRINSTKNTITDLNVRVSKSSTDIDGHSVTYHWRLDGGKWETTAPTQRLSSGNHTLELRARDELGLYSEIYKETFYVNPTQIEKKITLGPTGSKNQSTSFTVPYGSNFKVDSAVITNSQGGNVTATKSGSSINVSASNGNYYSRVSWTNPQRFSKVVSNVAVKRNGGSQSSVPSTYSYNKDGYTGTISYSGAATLVSGSAANTKSATHTINNQTKADKTFPSTYSYNTSGYKGTLSKDGSSYVRTGSVSPAEKIERHASRVKTPNCPTISGYTLDKCIVGASYAFVSGDNTWSLVREFYGATQTQVANNLYHEVLNTINDYKLTSCGWTCIQIGTRINVPFTLDSKTRNEKVTMLSSKRNSFNEYEYYGYYSRPGSDNRYYSQKYKGNVSKPDTRVWERKYSGTVYKPGEDFKDHKYKYDITIKYTVN